MYRIVVGVFVAALILASSGRALADPPAASPAPGKVDQAAIQKAVQRAADFLRTKAQTAEGAFSPETGAGVTAIVLAGLMRNGYGADDPVVARGLKYIEGLVQPNGGIYKTGSNYQNYETSLAVMCLSLANRDGRYAKQLKAADAYLKGEQWAEGKGIERTRAEYGGAGYGKHARPDLSNTQFFVEALRSCGNGPNDPAIQKALVFISNCQVYDSPHNTAGVATRNTNPDDQGSFIYTPAAGGVSMVPETAGTLRGYGSMTYAGLKSMIYAGVGPEDPRVKAAFTWIQKHYSVSTNPNMGDAGLFYYFHTFAKALSAMKLTEVEDAAGVKHDWRQDLAGELLKRQRDDGSWLNGNERWMESNPSLVTGYALLCLSYCR